MGSMNISLPEGLKRFVEQQVGNGDFGSASEYVRALIRRERDRLQLRAMLLEGASSPVEAELDAAYFDRLRGRLKQNTDS